MNEPVDQYADIIDLPPPRPHNRAPMPLIDRAAQFSPFAALPAPGDDARKNEGDTEGL